MSMSDQTEAIFIRLLALIRDDPDMTLFYQALNHKSALERNLLMTKMIEDMKAKNADKSHIESMELLRKDEVFRAVGKLIQERS